MALFDTNTNPFAGLNIFGAKPSDALTGILSTTDQEKLKNQALAQGVLGGLATYLSKLYLEYNNTNHSQNDMILKVFSINYNIFRIVSGMGGLSFSN